MGECLLPPRRGFFFEKWYFDAQAEDGTFLFGYFAPITLLAQRSAELVVWSGTPGGHGTARSWHLGARGFQCAGDRASVSFEGGELSVRGSSCGVQLKRDDVELRLTYDRLDPPWVPRGDGRLWHGRGRTLLWTVPLPNALATAHGHLGSVEISLQGHGYCDFVQTDLWPWQVPLRQLLWGRSLTAASTLIWEHASYSAGETAETVGLVYARRGMAPGAEVPIRCCDLGAWQADESAGERYPDRIGFAFGAAGTPSLIELGAHQRYLEAQVSDLQSFGGRMRQRFYGVVTGEPRTLKLCSPVTWDQQPHGLAAHEWVLWGRGAHRSL